MAVVRLFASAREAAGLSVDRIDGTTVAEVLEEARRRYGERFAAILTHSRVWVNGEPADVRAGLREGDVIAVLPPVSGGSDGAVAAGVVDGGGRHHASAVRTLSEPLPFTKPETDRSPSGWFRPPDVEALEIDGSLARLTRAGPVEEAPATLDGHRRRAAVARQPLAVVPDTDRPHVRLGLLWIVVTVAAVVGGTTILGLWMSAMAAVAAVQVTRVW
ncbi:MAG: MoaD/ThiS family protein, partial [Acidimicrobiia bacterium]|nr:MoaD/ThiS family protein [Acidimicrobiia bacterium]